jgi:hypothetical protein
MQNKSLHDSFSRQDPLYFLKESAFGEEGVAYPKTNEIKEISSRRVLRLTVGLEQSFTMEFF